MKRLLLIAAASSMLWPLSAGALTVESGQTILTDTTKTYTDIYAAGAGTIDVAATFGDDVLIGGGTVTISGPVKGDVLVAGGTIKITGDVAGSIRATGGTIEIDGVVGRNVLAAGGTIVFGPKANVAGEVTVMGGTITINGELAKDLNIWGGDIVINGKLNGNTSIRTGDDCGKKPCVTVGPKAVLPGDLTYWAAVEANVDADAEISGTVTRHPNKIIIERKLVEEIFTGFRIWHFFSGLVTGLFISLFLPKFVREVAEKMTTSPGRSMGIGAAVLFGGPLAILILFSMLVGIPLALILLAAYLIDVYIFQVFLGFFLGRVILDRFWPKNADRPSRVVFATLVGMFILSAVFDMMTSVFSNGEYWFLGMIAGFLRFALLLWTLGALVMVKWGYARQMAGR